ncbi:MAG: molybdopterin-binding protein [Smithellaceae bacterium]
MKVTVLTISDRASKGIYEDLSGPAIEKIIKESIADAEIDRVIVPDEKDEIFKALQGAASADFILTTGGYRFIKERYHSSNL